MGFQPQLRVITTMYSWTATQYWYHDDLAVTARLGSMAKTWVRRMLALAKQDISINTADVAKLSGIVGKKFDWHKSAGLERIYRDVGLFQFMRALRIKHPSACVDLHRTGYILLPVCTQSLAFLLLTKQAARAFVGVSASSLFTSFAHAPARWPKTPRKRPLFLSLEFRDSVWLPQSVVVWSRRSLVAVIRAVPKCVCNI